MNIYKRDELYEQVWAEPVRTVAKRYGVSDVALMKTCRKLGVPLPGRGYWARVAAGKKVRKSPLPPAKPGMQTEIAGYRSRPVAEDEPSPEALDLLSREKLPEMRIVVADELKSPHRLIEKYGSRVRKAAKSDRSVLRRRDCLDVFVGESTSDRAILVADALLKALEQRGFSVLVTKPSVQEERRRGYDPHIKTVPSKTGVEILGSFVEFGIEENYDSIKVDPKPSKRKSFLEDSTWAHTPPVVFERRHNGQLSLHIRASGDYHRRTWSDGSKQRIETCLNSFVVGLIQIAEYMRQERLKSARREREWAESEKRRAAEARRQAMEKELVEDLDARLNNVARAKSIREFLMVYEKRAGQEGWNVGPGTEVRRWLTWVDRYAERLQDSAVTTYHKMGQVEVPDIDEDWPDGPAD